MKIRQKRSFLPGVILIVVLQLVAGCSSFNSFQRDGELVLDALDGPVSVIRDEKGMPYIHAEHMDDLIRAQGFVAAQDRLFLMEVTRLLAEGRISELAGEKARELDIRMRTIGFLRNAKKHLEMLAPEEKRFFQLYVDGVNAYINTRQASHPLEFKLAGIRPGLWEVEDSLAILYYMGWNSAANLKSEIVAQMLVEKLGREKAEDIFPLTINPEDPGDAENKRWIASGKPLHLNLISDDILTGLINDGPLEIGSNNWAVAPGCSPNGKPVLANDPHLKSSILPGPWYPCGLITPDMRAVGVVIPGIPGIIIGRTEHVAMGVTNAYGDAQDLYIETIDPENGSRYLEGDTSIPFEVINETMKIKDADSETGFKEEAVTIRLTKRGPVVSHVMDGLETDKLLTVRWSAFEDMGPSMGLARILTSKNVYDVRNAIGDVKSIALNFVFADTQGNIGWQTSGSLPVREGGDGSVPHEVKNGTDNWTGRIPFNEMPSSINPEKGWIGTCNHKTVPADYPYYYSSHLSPSYRQKRLMQLLNAPGVKTVEDHWNFQRDTMNLMARDIAPVMAEALLPAEETADMGEVLSNWDYRDDITSAGPAVFQSVYREFAFLVFRDELGEKLAGIMLDNWYFWQERLGKMVAEGDSAWFDDVNTEDKTETMADLFRQAGLRAKEKAGDTLGGDPGSWTWGELHQMEFVSPIRRDGFGKGLLGAGSHPAPGSGETLYRGIYKFTDPFNVVMAASLRMVADLGDHDKILAVLPGGVSGRLFDPHNKDQVGPYMNGDKLYWWFSDRAIKDHRVSELVLVPEG